MERAEEVHAEAPQGLWLRQEFHGGHHSRGAARPRRIPAVDAGSGGGDEPALQLLRHELAVVHDVRIQVRLWVQIERKKTCLGCSRGHQFIWVAKWYFVQSREKRLVLGCEVFLPGPA